MHIAEGFQSVGRTSREQFDDHCVDHHCEVGAAVRRSKIAARRACPEAVIHGRLSPTNSKEIVVDTARVFIVWEFFELTSCRDDKRVGRLVSDGKTDLQLSCEGV